MQETIAENKRGIAQKARQARNLAKASKIADATVTLVERASTLISGLSCEPKADAADGLSGEEMGNTVAKTLALPEINPIRGRLLPEFRVYGLGDEDGVELATFGIVDVRTFTASNTWPLRQCLSHSLDLPSFRSPRCPERSLPIGRK